MILNRHYTRISFCKKALLLDGVDLKALLGPFLGISSLTTLSGPDRAALEVSSLQDPVGPIGAVLVFRPHVSSCSCRRTSRQ